jgi:transposase
MTACLEELYRLTKIEELTETSAPLITAQLQRYDSIIQEGLIFHQSRPPHLEQKEKPKRGKRKQPAGKNLLDILLLRKQEIIGFALNPKLPFSNNQAERDFRMEKVKQKISGCFRSFGSLVSRLIATWFRTLKRSFEVKDWKDTLLG